MPQTLRQYGVRFLRYLERYTRTDNVYLFKNGFFVFANQAFAILTGVGSYILIGHFLPKEIYGEYKYLLSLFGLYALSTLTGMNNALARSIAQGYDGSLKAAFKYKLLISLIASFVSIVGGIYAFLHQNPQLGLALFLIAIFSPFIYAGNLYLGYFTGRKNFRNYSLYSALTSALSFVGMALGIIYLRNPVWLFLVFLVTSCFNLIGYIQAERDTKNTNVDPALKSFAWHLSLLDVMGIIANNIDAVLAFHLLGSAALAVYAIAIIPGEQLKGLLRSVTAIALPKYVTKNVQDVYAGINRQLILVAGCSAVFVGLYIAAAPYIVHLLLPRYLDSVPYSQAYSLSVLFVLPATLLTTLFTAKGMKAALTKVNAASYSLQILFMVIGAFTYGLWGLIISRLASRVVLFIAAYGVLFSEKRRGRSDTSAAA